MRATGVGSAVGVAGLLWGARGLTQAGQHALVDLAKQEERCPEQSVEVTFEQPYQARRQWQRRFLTS